VGEILARGKRGTARSILRQHERVQNDRIRQDKGTARRQENRSRATDPDNPIIPYIEGDGIGIDITPVMKAVVDAAVKKAYGGKKQIHWMEVYAGEKSTKIYGADVWLPEETLAALKDFSVSIKGPMTTPVGGGIRSLNVALRQELDLYQCVRPVRYFKGVPSPLKDPTRTDMVIFRENTEDIYAGIEWAAESESARKLIKFLQEEMGSGRSASPPPPA